jgi:hypothetical protein
LCSFGVFRIPAGSEKTAKRWTSKRDLHRKP